MLMFRDAVEELYGKPLYKIIVDMSRSGNERLRTLKEAIQYADALKARSKCTVVDVFEVYGEDEISIFVKRCYPKRGK